MSNKNYYTAGQFAKKANVTIRTIRYYDTKGLLKPSSVNDAGYRLYTDDDYAKLQRILTLKYLGFSLEEISISIMNEGGIDWLKESLDTQMKIVKDKINHMFLIQESIKEAQKMLENKNSFNWNKIINIIHMLNMEKDLVEQYKDSQNLNIRIKLHKRFGTNKCDWFHWIFQNMKINFNEKILELGCGNGELWKVNSDEIPKNSEIVLTDISEGMLNDAKYNLKDIQCNMNFDNIDCQKLPYEDESFDVVVANHMIFYIKDREKAFKEITRVLRKGGRFYCSTYGLDHMQEIQELTKRFDSRITLSEVKLPEIFGLENGEAELKLYFNDIDKFIYKDYLMVDDYKPLLEYILSCHGNEHEILNGNYGEFENYVKSKLEKLGVLKITKCAGLFQCVKN